jgi:exocyst complex component 2
MFETLMYLVEVHAQVSEVAPPLLDRTLNALVESLVEEALRCFKQVKRFGMGGMLRVGFISFFFFNWSPPPLTHRSINFFYWHALHVLHVVAIWLTPTQPQATLEIEFMHQTLSRYVTSNTAKMLSDLYTKISQAYARRPGDENLQSNLDGVKRTLSETRRRTGIEFLCFRVTKEKGAGGDKGDKGDKRDKKDRGARTSGNAREQRGSS